MKEVIFSYKESKTISLYNHCLIASFYIWDMFFFLIHGKNRVLFISIDILLDL